MSSFRIDIQALRGYAVLLVVLHHLKMPWLPAGFLGVDIFFVISGFLITGVIKDGMDKGTFRLGQFYFRRAKRLLPAAYVTFFVTAVGAFFLLNQQELHDFSWQMFGAITFTGNIVLLNQADYFQNAAELKPLLHIWSLAIEEQYYLLLPISLLLIPRKHWLRFVFMAAMVSLGFCVFENQVNPAASFYLLPSRAWEMGAGSIGALLGGSRSVERGARYLFWPALSTVIVLPFFPFAGMHPGVDAALMCAGTLVVLLRNHANICTSKPVAGVAAVGNFSYSLYLVHWPLIAFANNAWVGNPAGTLPLPVKWGLFAVALLLGYVLYRYVETPVRRKKFAFSTALLGKTIAVSVALTMTASTAAIARPKQADYSYLRRINYGFSDKCEYEQNFSPLPECANAAAPAMLVWGDSYAMHLVPGLAATSRFGIIQATRSQCAAFLGIAPVSIDHHAGGQDTNAQWAKDCIAFNDSVLQYLSTADSITVVVLSSPFGQYLDTDRFRMAQRNGASVAIAEINVEKVAAAFERTVNAIRALGKRVVVVAPPPSGEFNMAACVERITEHYLVFGAPQNCEIPLMDYRSSGASVSTFLNHIEKEARVEVFTLDKLLCNERTCKTSIDQVSIYRDAGHLSYDGSILIAKKLNLGETLYDRAR